MAARFASRSRAGPRKGVQVSDSADHSTTSMPARKAGAVSRRRVASRTGRWRRSITLAMMSRMTAMGARITEARRATCARTGSTTNRPKKPMRRSRAAASRAGSMVDEFDARGIWRLLPNRDGRIPARYARRAQAAVDAKPHFGPHDAAPGGLRPSQAAVTVRRGRRRAARWPTSDTTRQPPQAAKKPINPAASPSALVGMAGLKSR